MLFLARSVEIKFFNKTPRETETCLVPKRFMPGSSVVHGQFYYIDQTNFIYTIEAHIHQKLDMAHYATTNTPVTLH